MLPSIGGTWKNDWPTARAKTRSWAPWEAYGLELERRTRE